MAKAAALAEGYTGLVMMAQTECDDLEIFRGLLEDLLPGVGVVAHLGLLGQYGGRMLAAIVLSTWAGMAVAALVLQALWPADVPADAPADAAADASAEPPAPG